MRMCGAIWTKNLSDYTRLVWFLRWLDAAAHFAVFNVDRESGRDVKVKKPRCRCFLRLDLLGSPFGFPLFCGVLPDAGAAFLPLIMFFSWLCCGFVIAEDAHGAKRSELESS